MESAPTVESERLAALQSFRVLDTPPEPGFDGLARLAAEVCGTPAALVSLVDDDRQWFKSHYGLDVSETPREVSFCAHALASDDVMVVPDATLDERFRANPLVVEGPELRFYAGVPLVVPGGHRLGTLCVVDWAPRVLSERQIATLRMLAQQVVSLLVVRRHADDLLAEQQRSMSDILSEDARLQGPTGQPAHPPPE